MKRYLIFLLLMVSSMALPSALHAQTNDGDWFADDDEETEEMLVDDSEAWDVAPGKFDDVKIKLNGELVALGDDYTFNKDDVLSVQVRHLQPHSRVAIHIKKGGIKLKKTSFQANEKGQLDLEIKTGKKRVKGAAVLYYTPSNGKKKQMDAHVAIQ